MILLAVDDFTALQLAGLLMLALALGLHLLRRAARRAEDQQRAEVDAEEEAERKSKRAAERSKTRAPRKEIKSLPAAIASLQDMYTECASQPHPTAYNSRGRPRRTAAHAPMRREHGC